MKYSKLYREHDVLDDGVDIEFRAIQPSDKGQLSAAFDRLSEQSRYRRFNTAKRSLSPDELRFLTEYDGVDHFAIVAVVADSDTGASRGVGVARLVRSDSDPSAAELAIVVADDWQRRGIGRRLLERIVAAASERGMQRIVAVTQADNEQIRGLFSQYADQLDLSVKNGETTISVPIPRADTSGHATRSRQ